MASIDYDDTPNLKEVGQEFPARFESSVAGGGSISGFVRVIDTSEITFGLFLKSQAD